MKRIVRLTESDLVRLVKRVINEQSEGEIASAKPLQLRYDNSKGGSSENQLKLLLKHGQLVTTQNQKINPENARSGIYKFSAAELPGAMETGSSWQALKNLVNYIKSKGINANNIVDVILDFPIGTNVKYKG